jgi:hypothetical protein
VSVREIPVLAVCDIYIFSFHSILVCCCADAIPTPHLTPGDSGRFVCMYMGVCMWTVLVRQFDCPVRLGVCVCCILLLGNCITCSMPVGRLINTQCIREGGRLRVRYLW